MAGRLFLRNGYAATTVAAVAAAADVSVETIYKTFGGKPGLIRAIQQSGLAGAGPVPAPDRSDEMSAQDVPPRAVLRHWATLTNEVMPRVAPITLLVRAAAATDPEMGALLAEINDERLARMHHNAVRLARLGPLRTGMSIEQARDVMFTFTAPELYEILVMHQQWTTRPLRRLHLPRTRRRTPGQPRRLRILSNQRPSQPRTPRPGGEVHHGVDRDHPHNRCQHEKLELGAGAFEAGR